LDDNAKILIWQLVQQNPKLRPSALDLFSSEFISAQFLNQDTFFQKYCMVLRNLKNVENIRLMSFLFSRPVKPKLSMTYEGGPQQF